MNVKEGAPRRTADEPQQSRRTTTHTTTTSAFTHGYAVSTPTHRRWRKRPRTVTMLACDVLAWTIFTVLTGVVLIACCLLLWAIA